MLDSFRTDDGEPVKWEWTSEQEEAFNKLKHALAVKPVMGYFDPHKQTEIVVDTSPVGLSVILTQHSEDA